MLTLGLDTATDWGCLGLVRDGSVLAETGWKVGRNHAEQFLPVLDEMMRRCGQEPAALDLIAVGCGPGSYTGLRIGLAIARALSFSLAKPVTGVGTLAALAENGAGFPGLVGAVLAARRAEIYAAVYEGGEAVIPPAPFSPDKLLERLAAYAGERILLLGTGAEMVAGLGRAHFPGLSVGRPEQNLPRGSSVARLGASAPVTPPSPAYLRRTEAEEKRYSTVEKA